MTTATSGKGDGTFGLPTATALVIGSVIGTGVFAVPSALAVYGPGGPYVYARNAFGEFGGFLNAWSYWITVSNAALQKSTAPFTDSANAIFGGYWAGDAIAIAAVISGVGCLIGWTLIVAEMPLAAARDGLFPVQFARTPRGVPVFGIVASTVLASVLTVISYTSFDKVFTTLVLLGIPVYLWLKVQRREYDETAVVPATIDLDQGVRPEPAGVSS